jgi:hypothetical protein
MTMRSRDWGESLGKRVIDLSGDFPVPGDMMMPPLEKGARVSAYERSGSEDISAEGDVLMGVVDHSSERSKGDIAGYGLPQLQPYTVPRSQGILPRRPVGSPWH